MFLISSKHTLKYILMKHIESYIFKQNRIYSRQSNFPVFHITNECNGMKVRKQSILYFKTFGLIFFTIKIVNKLKNGWKKFYRVNEITSFIYSP